MLQDQYSDDPQGQPALATTARFNPRRWPTDAFEATREGLRLSDWYERRGRREQANWWRRYAEYKMDELREAGELRDDQTIVLSPGMDPLTDDEAAARVKAVQVNQCLSRIATLRAHGGRESAPHIARLAGRLATLRTDLRATRRVSTRPRARGAGRPAGKRPGPSRRASRAGASSDPGEPGEAEPDPGRVCQWCGADISDRAKQARYCSDAHGKRHKREQNAARPGNYRPVANEEFVFLASRVCDCNGTHIAYRDDDGDRCCAKCGKPRDGERRTRFAAEAELELLVTMRQVDLAPPRPRRSPHQWRTRPTTAAAP